MKNLAVPCGQEWRDHHRGTGIARTNVLVCMLKDNPVAGLFTAKLGNIT